MKICFKCNKEKDIIEFYKHSQMKDGHLNKCKECTKKDSIAQYEEKIKNVEWHLKERKRGRIKWAKYKYKSKVGKIVANKNYELKYPGKKKATSMVRSALYSGKLVKENCKICGTSQNIEAHHPDYSKPLEVIWLCVRHHNDEHIRLREVELKEKY